jgi:hypothetical protein
MESLFWQVLGNRDLRAYIFSFQRGRAYKDWVDGDKAAALNYLELLKAKAAEGAEMKFSTKAIDRAAANGHLVVVQWLHTNRTEGCTTRAMDYASLKGHLEIVQYLNSVGKRCTKEAMDMASKYGHLAVVQWLHTNRLEGCTAMAMNQAARNGHIDIVKYLYETRKECCTILAYNNIPHNTEIGKWLSANHKNNCICEQKCVIS